jgi:hypothetical protein
MTTIGIDPGTNGGIAWITDGRACAEKMPDTLQDLWELVQDIQSNGQCHAFVEQVHSSPQMGVKSAFTFGQGFGHLEMALTAAGIPFERVRPQVKITHAIADSLLIAEYGRRVWSTLAS